jgi:hypothetical protein
MKKRFIVCLLISLFLCLDNIYAEATSWIPALNRINARGKIIFVIIGGGDFPILFTRDGSWQGVEMDTLSILAKEMGVPWEIYTCKDSREAFSALGNGLGDILVGGLKKNIADARFLVYSRPFFRAQYFILYNRLSLAGLKEEKLALNPKGLLGRSGFALGLVEGSSSDFYVQREYRNSKVKRFRASKEVIDSLIRDDVQLSLLNEWEYRNYFNQNMEMALFWGAFPLPACDDYCFAVSWKDRDLIRVIDHSISLSEAERSPEAAVRKTYYSWR